MSPLGATTHSAEQTRSLGAALAPLLRPGDLVLLSGDLGAGKTALTQGLGLALGIHEPITSPTFTLVRQYPGRPLGLIHADVYRLDRLEEIADLGLVELVDERSVAVIEWGDMAEPVLPADFCEVRIGFGERDDDRDFIMRLVGSWIARRRVLAEALAPFAPVTGVTPDMGEAR